MIILDTEIYHNYFLLSMMDSETKKVRSFELYEGQDLDIKSIIPIMKNHTTVGFNSAKFDLPIIVGALSGFTNKKIKAVCDAIIQRNLPPYKVASEFGIKVPSTFNHIDLIEVAAGKASLKIYGGRLHAQKMQDLPIEPDTILSREQMVAIRDYCENDLHTTNLLYQTLKPQIALREKMSEQYGIDLRSKSDAQIAEAVIVSELKKITGKDYKKLDVPDGQVFKYKDPKIISFKTKKMQDLFGQILNTRFEVGGNGSIVLPEWMKNYDLTIGTTKYKLGIGGLHSCEKAQFISSDDNYVLCDKDVVSYYPNIILQQQLSPKSMGLAFIKVYQSIVERRIEAKKAGDKVTADVLKIVVNGSFGKLGSKYSTLYAPELLIQTTITGQLALLMLIERMELEGIKIVSANTDGIVIYCHKDKQKLMEQLAFEWMLDTSFELETTYYTKLASRDVNNYVAVTTNGKTKGKGLFAGESLAKNPDFSIVPHAVAMFVANDTPLEDTIKSCTDIRKFVSVRRVQGGAMWRDNYLGKAVRFYRSSDISSTECITYSKNSNKVPKSSGARPLMELPATLPKDIDYNFYISEATDLLKEVGYA